MRMETQKYGYPNLPAISLLTYEGWRNGRN